MNIRIEAAQGGEIHLSPVLPASLQQLRIPDSICYGAVGPFGHVLVQQLEGEDVSILYHTLYFNQGEQVVYTSEEAAIRLQIVLRNSYYYDSRYFGEGALHERGLSLNYVPVVHSKLKLHPGEVYSHLSVYYGIKHLLPLQNSFPGLMSFLAKVSVGQPGLFGSGYTIADAGILSVVDNILDCNYQGHLRKLYLGHLSVELLLLALVRLSASHPSASGTITEEDAKRIYKAKELVLQDLGGNMSLGSLADQTGLSVYKLNHGFKAIYGIGVTEFLHECRMKKAHQALSETDKSVEAIARESGYSHSESFSLAFKKYFNYTPAFVQRSRRTQGLANE
jgi:AraC-like DNA-binding protein